MIKDFSILLEPINTNSNKKDVGIVSGYNAYSQYIENVLKTQKNEVVSNMDFGSEYFSFIFGSRDVPVLELKLAAYIQSAIPKLTNIRVKLSSQTSNNLAFNIFFDFYDGIKMQQNLSCNVEVPI